MLSDEAFPETHYPCQTLSHRKSVKLPDGYGCFQAADLVTGNIQDEEESPQQFRFQYHHGNEGCHLEANEPTLPLLQPSECSNIILPGIQDLARITWINRVPKIQDRAVEQALYFYKKFPQHILGSSLNFLKDSYIDMTGKRELKFKKQQLINPVVSLGKVRNKAEMPKLKDLLEPALYDIHPNMLLSLLKEDIDDSIHKQYINQDYYGGCLAYASLPPSSGHEGLLFYPNGPTLEVLNIQALPHQEVPIYSIKHSPHRCFAVSSPVRQIETVTVPYRGSILAGVRTDYQCCIMKVTTKKNKVKGRVSNLIHSQQKIASVALSPYICGECVMGLDTGGIQLVDPENEPTCIRKTPELGDQSPRRCHYSGHPRLLVAHQRKSVDLVDCRASVESGNCCLLSLPSKDLPRDQEIFVAKQHPGNRFYHFVATQNLLLLLDERFPKYNVLQWSHSLSTPPNYMDIVLRAVNLDDPNSSGLTASELTSSDLTSNLIILASQCSREVHCFQCSELNGQTPEMTSLPWKIAAIDGWLDLLPEYPVGDLDPVRSRLDRPLIGMTAARRAPCVGCEPGVTVFQQSSAGDLFFQTYSQKNATEERRDKTLSLGPGCPQVKLTQESLANCKEWVEGVLLQTACKTPQAQKLQSFKEIERDRAVKAVVSMISPSSPDKACRICNITESQELESPQATDPSQPCPACGVKISDGSELKERLEDGEGPLHKRRRGFEDKEEEEGEVLPGRIHPRKYRDEISKTLHRAWVHGYDGDGDDDDDNDDEPDQDFTTTPKCPRRTGQPSHTPDLFTPSQTYRSQLKESHYEAEDSLDMAEQQRVADATITPKARVSQRKKVKRTMMGF